MYTKAWLTLKIVTQIVEYFLKNELLKLKYDKDKKKITLAWDFILYYVKTISVKKGTP